MSSLAPSYSDSELNEEFEERDEASDHYNSAEYKAELEREIAERIAEEIEFCYDLLDWDMEDRIAELPQQWRLHEIYSKDPDPTDTIIKVCREKGQLALELDPNIDRYDLNIDFDLDEMMRAVIRSSVSAKFFDNLELTPPATSKDTAHRLRRLKRARRRQDHGTRGTKRDTLVQVERCRLVKPLPRVGGRVTHREPEEWRRTYTGFCTTKLRAPELTARQLVGLGLRERELEQLFEEKPWRETDCGCWPFMECTCTLWCGCSVIDGCGHTKEELEELEALDTESREGRDYYINDRGYAIAIVPEPDPESDEECTCTGYWCSCS